MLASIKKKRGILTSPLVPQMWKIWPTGVESTFHACGKIKNCLLQD